MKKIIVIGCPGAGKSTFARKLRDATGIPLYYLDMLYHKPDKTIVKREEFDIGLNDIIKKDNWIIDGNYQRTLELRLRECDTVFFFFFSLDVCLMGAESRVGKKREDMPWVETELDEDFRQCIIDYPKESLQKTYQLLKKYKEKNIIIFTSREEADEYVKNQLKNKPDLFL